MIKDTVYPSQIAKQFRKQLEDYAGNTEETAPIEEVVESDVASGFRARARAS